MGFWYGLDGKPIGIEEADQLLRDFKKRRLALTLICRRPAIAVSTVFLVLDHGFMGTTELWETRVFGGPDDGWEWRSAIRSEARVVHRAHVIEQRRALAQRVADRRRVTRLHSAYRARRA